MARVVNPDDDLVVISTNGQVIRMFADGIPHKGRPAQGVAVMNMRDSDEVASIARVPRTDKSGKMIGDEELEVLHEDGSSNGDGNGNGNGDGNGTPEAKAAAIAKMPKIAAPADKGKASPSIKDATSTPKAKATPAPTDNEIKPTTSGNRTVKAQTTPPAKDGNSDKPTPRTRK